MKQTVEVLETVRHTWGTYKLIVDIKTSNIFQFNLGINN
jgi:hypothetical protein